MKLLHLPTATEIEIPETFNGKTRTSLVNSYLNKSNIYIDEISSPSAMDIIDLHKCYINDKFTGEWKLNKIKIPSLFDIL